MTTTQTFPVAGDSTKGNVPAMVMGFVDPSGNFVPVSASNPLPGSGSGGGGGGGGSTALNLLAGGSATSAGQTWPGGDGQVEVMGNLNGAIASFQYLGADGVSWIEFGGAADFSAPGTAIITCKANASVRCALTGGSPSGIYATVTQVQVGASAGTTAIALLTAGSATGAGHTWPGGDGQFEVMGTFGGATAQLQMLGVDTTSWIPFTGLDASFSFATTGSGTGLFTCKAGAQIRLALIGGTPSGIFSSATQVV